MNPCDAFRRSAVYQVLAPPANDRGKSLGVGFDSWRRLAVLSLDSTGGAAATRKERDKVSRLGIGIIGCGEVTQIIHLPSLRQLNDLFVVTAICDVSQRVLDGVGDEWGIHARLIDYRELLALDSVDAVLIANPNAFHAEMTIAALRAGLHVLVEKPMCLNLAENDAIIAAEKETGMTVQVGTMRRYAPAFLEACRIVKDMDEIHLAKAQDIIGRNSLVIEPTASVVRGDDIPEALAETMRQLEAEQIRAAIGEVSDDLKTAYRMMLGLSTHDTSAMREMLGMPKRVLHATQRGGGRYLTATFDYGDFVCLFTTGGDSIPRYDTYLEVYGANQVIRVDYDTPYVRNMPITVSVLESADGVYTTSSRRHPAWGDAFTEEWRAFHHHVVNGEAAKTSPQDFREDLVLFRDMIRLMAGSETA